MDLLECPFSLLVLGPFLRQWSASRRALEDATPTLDKRRGHGFEKDSIRCRLNHGLSPVLDVELFAQAKRDNDLALRRERYGLDFLSRTHMRKYDMLCKVRQDIRSRNISSQKEFCSKSGFPPSEGWRIFARDDCGRYE